MTHKQYPIGSGFSAAATADEVLAGIDLTGRNVIITGGHSGIGLEATRALGKAGASVTVGARDPGRAAEAVAGITGVEVARLDLMDPASIEAFAARWRDSGRPLHILINCAGLPPPRRRLTDARGYEAQFATNHLGHFQLTRDLLPALRAARGARVVTVSSGAQRFADIRWDDPHFTEATIPAAPMPSPRRPTCCSPSSWIADTPRTASAATPCIPASSSAPVSTVRPVKRPCAPWG